MDLDPIELDLNSERIVEDLSELVESIYNDHTLYPGLLSESSPEIGSEDFRSPAKTDEASISGYSPAHCVYSQAQFATSGSVSQPTSSSPSSSPAYKLSPPEYVSKTESVSESPNYYTGSDAGSPTCSESVTSPTHLPDLPIKVSLQDTACPHRYYPDLSGIDYSGPLQLLEQWQRPPASSRPMKEPAKVILSKTGDQGGIVDKASVEVVPKKRRLSEDSNYQTRQVQIRSPETDTKVKSELALSPSRLLSSSQNTTFESSNLGAANSQRNILFGPLLPNKWCKIYDCRLQELATPKLVVVADKGFNFSTVDEAFIVQKKNHFQLTCNIEVSNSLHFVQTPDGEIAQVVGLRMNFYGVRSESLSTTIKVEQSQADRSKRMFNPVQLEFGSGPDTYQTSKMKVTVGRLHFAETTSNNMRKKGKPNPAQKYFQLVASLEATAALKWGKQKEFELTRMASEKIIVRASNPGQFESDAEVTWCREPYSETLYHMGKVGVNTDQCSEALTVHGNIQVTGQVFQPSDVRIKEALREIDSKEQLEKVKQIKIFRYNYRSEFLPHDIEDPLCNRSQTGVIAQEVQRVLPEAVSSSGPYILNNGEIIDDLLIVDKDRLFLENIGAVNELSKMTCDLGDRIEDLEKANENIAVRLAKLKSRSGSSSTCSFNSESLAGYYKRSCTRKSHRSLFYNRYIQAVLLGLVSLAALSIMCIAVVYVMDHTKRSVFGAQELNSGAGNATEVTIPFIGDSSSHAWKSSTVLPTEETPAISTSFIHVHDLSVPVIGSLSLSEETSCHSQNSPRCQSFCCPPSLQANSTEFGKHYTTQESGANHQMSNNLYFPEFNEMFFVREDSTSTSTTSSTMPPSSPLPTLSPMPSPETPMPYDTQMNNEMMYHENKHEISSPETEDLKETASPRPEVQDIKQDEDTLQQEVRDVKPEVKLTEDQESDPDSLSSTHYQLKSDIHKTKESTIREILEEKKENRLEEALIENYASSVETVNEVEHEDEEDILEEIEKSESAYFDSVDEKRYSNYSRNNTMRKERNYDGGASHETSLNKSDVGENLEPKVGPSEQPFQVNSSDVNMNAARHTRSLRRRTRDTLQQLSGDPHYPVLPSQPVWPTLMTASYGSISLDHRFCDTTYVSEFANCISGSWSNVSLSVPISRHFVDNTVRLTFPATNLNRLSVCSYENRGYPCSDERPIQENTIVHNGPDGQLGLDVSVTEATKVKLRLSLDPSIDVSSLCGLQPKKVGSLFKEYHIEFKRICNV